MPEGTGDDPSRVRMVGWAIMLNIEVIGLSGGGPPVVAVNI